MRVCLSTGTSGLILINASPSRYGESFWSGRQKQSRAPCWKTATSELSYVDQPQSFSLLGARCASNCSADAKQATRRPYPSRGRGCHRQDQVRPHREVADLLDGALGQASQFDAEFGYYCDGVEPETAVLPDDWRDRAKLYSSPATNGVEALAPEPNDIALSKVVAWRPKDVAWLRAAVRSGIIEIETMLSRLVQMPARAGDIADLKTRLEGLR